MDSKIVFELRKEAKVLSGYSKLNKLNEALKKARELYIDFRYDEWIKKALAYTLIDLCKYHLETQNVKAASDSFSELNSIFFIEKDEIIENQKNYLRPKIDDNYKDILKGEELSKNGKHEESLLIFKHLISQNRISELHHESYGWVIYRYIKAKENELSSIQVRTFLRDYLRLKNEKPSMLHSTILNFALQYSKEHSDLNLYKFFKLWDPKYLRDEDKFSQFYNDKEFPSLVSRVLKEFVEKDYEFEIDYLISNIEIDDYTLPY